MTTIDSEGHVLLDVTRPDGSHEEVQLADEGDWCWTDEYLDTAERLRAVPK